MSNKRWIFLIVLFVLACVLLNTWFNQERNKETPLTVSPVTESKVEAVALEQNTRFIETAAHWQKNKDPWYEQATKTSKPEEPGDEENSKDVISLM